MTDDKLRESLEDLLALARRLAPLCERVDELMGIVDLALTNPAQLRLLGKELQRSPR